MGSRPNYFKIDYETHCNAGLKSSPTQSSLRLFFTAVGVPSERIDFLATDSNTLMGYTIMSYLFISVFSDVFIG
jgi:hypothetical protein